MDTLKILLTALRDMSNSAIELLPQLLVATVVIVFTYLVAKLIRIVAKRILNKSKMRKSLINLLILLSSLGIWVLGMMAAAIALLPNLTPTKMLAGLGIGSVAIGFAFKDIFENFLSGIIILLRREMRIGDFIECEGLEGEVENISVRETHIR